MVNGVTLGLSFLVPEDQGVTRQVYVHVVASCMHNFVSCPLAGTRVLVGFCQGPLPLLVKFRELFGCFTMVGFLVSAPRTVHRSFFLQLSVACWWRCTD